MSTLRRTFLGFFAAALAVAAIGAAMPSAAQSIRDVVNDAKAAGIVGEQADGFVGVRDESRVTPAIRAAMAQMNAGRAELYRQAAQQTGTSAAAAGASSFTQRFNDIPAGQWYRNSAGTWVRK